LALKDCKNLWLIAKKYFKITQGDRFKDLLKQKIKQKQEDKLYQETVNYILKRTIYGFHYYINNMDKSHRIYYYGIPRGYIIKEEFQGFEKQDYIKQSILRRLYGENAMIVSKN
jgi:hypothetical protein